MHRARQTSFSFLSKEQIAVCLNKNNELHLRIIRYFIINSFFFFITSFTNLLWLGVRSPYYFSFAQHFKAEGLDQVGLVSFWLNCLSISASSLKFPKVKPLCIPWVPAAGYCSVTLPLSHSHVLSAGFTPIPVPLFPYFSLLGIITTKANYNQDAAVLTEPWGELGTSWFELICFLWSPSLCCVSQVALVESTSFRAGAILVPSSWKTFNPCAVK